MTQDHKRKKNTEKYEEPADEKRFVRKPDWDKFSNEEIDEDESIDDPTDLFHASYKDTHVLLVMDHMESVWDVFVEDKPEREKSGEKANIASMIDHTLLKADATHDQIVQLCNEARENKFASVCVNGTWVRLCAELLRGTDVRVCTVVGFPLGAMDTRAKAFEAAIAVENGAREVDMVLNIGALKGKDYQLVADDIFQVIRAVKDSAIVKVILETCLLTEEEMKIACLMSQVCGAMFVKTSTGFSTGGAKVEDVRNMRKWVDEEVEVKASGGIRTLADVRKMIDAGATRIGTSSGVAIVNEVEN